MEADFLAAVVDTLLPGLPSTPTQSALPAASQLGVDLLLANHLRTHPQRERWLRLLQTIIQQAGGMDRFVTADEGARIAVLQAVEQADTPTFQVFMLIVAADYYQTDEVQRAFGWFADPPQPRGYPLPLWDEGLLAPVQQRPALWRQV